MKLGFGLLAFAAATAAAGPAAADERAMFVSAGGTMGVGESADSTDDFGEPYDPEGVLIGRVLLSWELPPLPYKEPKGIAWRGSVAPEVIFGRIHVADHRTGDSDDNSANFVALGGRLEAGMSQHKMGLLQMSARGAFYAAGRIGLLDDPGRTRLLEVTAGEYLYAGDSVRFGAELGFFGLFPTQQQDEQWVIREGVAARGPWLDNVGDYYAFVGTVYLGVKL